jgi:hypothetical protein
MEIGTVLTTTLGLNRDGTTPVRLMSVQFADLTDIRTVQLLAADDYNPSPQTKVAVYEVEPSWEVGIPLEQIGAAALTAAGERVVSADILGVSKSYIAWRNTGGGGANGCLELNGATDFAVAYNDLKIAFDQLKSDFDDHLHTFADTYTATPTLTTAPTNPVSVPKPSTADMTPAKVATVKLP